jgi:hypothetical protein
MCILANDLRFKFEKYSKLVVYAAGGEAPEQLANQFLDLFQGLGIDVIQREVPSNATNEVRLFVDLRDPHSPSDDAKVFMVILHKANLDTHYAAWQLIGSPEQKNLAFNLYVAKLVW